MHRVWLLLAAACTPSAHSLGLQTGTLDHQGRTRTFHVHVPPEPADAPPLVVALHGGGGRGLLLNRSTKGSLHAEADRRGWIVVAPDGVANGWNDGRKLVSRRDALREGVDDVGFIAALVDRMVADHGIDPRRVYATGISNGGFMSLRLAIDLSDRIAAIAPVTASLGRVLEDRPPGDAVSVMLVNGTDDPLVPYEGGQVKVLGRERGAILSTDDTVRWWRTRNGCSDETETSTLPDVDPDDGTRVHRIRYPACRDGTEVALLRVEGGGHTWPSGTQYLPKVVIGVVSHDIDGSHEIFDFFAAH